MSLSNVQVWQLLVVMRTMNFWEAFSSKPEAGAELEEEYSVNAASKVNRGEVALLKSISGVIIHFLQLEP